MLLRHLYEHSLAHSSYLVGSSDGRALVVDPNLDIATYQAAAAAEELQIAAVLETHIHADFVSGARALAADSGAVLHVSGEGGAEWQYDYAREPGVRVLRNGDVIELGSVRLEVLHTPGHTPEHLMFLVTDGDASDTPIGAFTGDFLFVGDAGRPDLLETAAGYTGTMESSARELFRSLGTLRALPDHLLIWPAHGSGSVCGKSLSGVPASSLGYERLTNWALRESDEEAFVRAILEDQPEPPMYFAEMKQVNRAGSPAWTPAPLREVSGGAEVETAVRGRTLVIDVRRGAASAHLPGALVIPMGHSFPTWAGSVVPPVTPFLVVAEHEEEASSACRLMALVGRRDSAGWISPRGLAAYREAGGQFESLDTVTHPAGRTPLDVRTIAEWRSGHLAEALHMPLARLPERAAALDRDTPLLVYCQQGARSTVAASALRRLGFTRVATLTGGYNSVMGSGLITTS